MKGSRRKVKKGNGGFKSCFKIWCVMEMVKGASEENIVAKVEKTAAWSDAEQL